MEFLKELWAFLRVRKKLWLAPIIIVMLILGGLLILAQGSVVALIYTLFRSYSCTSLVFLPLSRQRCMRAKRW